MSAARRPPGEFSIIWTAPGETDKGNFFCLVRKEESLPRHRFRRPKKGWLTMTRREDFIEPRLPFPLRRRPAAGGTVDVYVIPDDKKQAVLMELYPFAPVPSLDEEVYDLHADKKFKVKDFCVTREGGMNFLVSPYYFESGGTVIDWLPADCADE